MSIPQNNLEEIILSDKENVMALVSFKQSEHYKTLMWALNEIERKSNGLLISHLSSTEHIQNREQISCMYVSDINSVRRIRRMFEDVEARLTTILDIEEKRSQRSKKRN